MIHGYLATFGCYGSWLPNDPRGSKSKFVGSRRLYGVGGGATNRDSKPFSRLTRDERQLLSSLSRSLKRPRVVFSDLQVSQTGHSICDFVADECRVVWALAVLPTHVHITFARGRTSSEDFVTRLKQYIQERLTIGGLLPEGCDMENSVWAVGQWIDYLDSEKAIDDAIHYTVANISNQGVAQQSWSGVTPFAGISTSTVKYQD